MSTARLPKLKLSDEERKLLSAPPKAGDLEKLLKEIADEKKGQLKRSKIELINSVFMKGFCDVAARTSGIVEILLPQSPEYSILYGMLIILFKVCLRVLPLLSALQH
jgi:hypothetical protein